jgi:hypothetical protein
MQETRPDPFYSLLLLCGLYSFPFFERARIPFAFWKYSKGKNSLNVFYCLIYAGQIVTVFCCEKWALILWYVGVVIVFMPSLVEDGQFFVCEEKAEIVDCRLMFEKSSFKEGLKFEIMTRILESGKLRLESGPEIQISSISFIDFRQTERKPESKPSAEQDTNNSASHANKCYFVGIQFYLSAFLG